ncbi:MAG TPA: PilZ domain-containing protein [Planctomycetota bacterium]|nr:PilZ domain-containing protein [Planctomycetota bacterium]
MSWKTVGDDPAFEALSKRKGVMQNISGGGVCFYAETDPGVGVMLALSLDLPGLPASVLSLGRTVWTKPSGAGYEVGVEFWWIGWKDEDAQAQIRGFIADKLKAREGR